MLQVMRMVGVLRDDEPPTYLDGETIVSSFSCSYIPCPIQTLFLQALALTWLVFLEYRGSCRKSVSSINDMRRRTSAGEPRPLEHVARRS